MPKFIKYSDKYREQVEYKIFCKKLFLEYTSRSLKMKLFSFLGIYKNYLYLLVDENNDKVIGSVLVIYRLNRKSLGKNWWLYGLHINKEYRRSGYGVELTEKVCNLIKDLGAKSVLVYVYKDNFKSLELCKKRGFEIIEKSKEHTIYEQKHLLELQF